MRKVPLLIIFLVALHFYSDAQWQQTHGPYGGTINCLAVSGSDIFAGTTGGGIFLTQDEGANWSSVNMGLTGFSCFEAIVKSMAVNGSTVLAGTSGNGLFISDDSGASWLPVNTLSAFDVNTIAVSGACIYAGTNFGGVYISNDSGTNWISAGLNNLFLTSLVVKANKIFAGTSTQGIYMSDDNGATWEEANNGLTSNNILSIAVVGTQLFVSSPAGVYVSVDEGSSWDLLNNGLPGFNQIIGHENQYYAATNNGVYGSSDNGTSWNSLNNGLNYLHVKAMTSIGTKLFAGTKDGGVFMSADDGSIWLESNRGLANTAVDRVVVQGEHVFACTSTIYPCKDVVSHSANDGIDWSTSNTSYMNADITSMAVLGTHVFAGTDSQGVYRSPDNGVSWYLTSLNGLSIASLVVCNNKIFAGTQQNGLWVSMDNGITWETVTSFPANSFWMLGATGIQVYAMTEIGLLRSDDTGLNWIEADTAGVLGEYSEYLCFTSLGNNLYISGCENGVFWSTDSGVSWTAVNNGLNGMCITSLSSRNNILFAATECAGVFISADLGDSWLEWNTGLRNSSVMSLSSCAMHIFAATNGSGVWMRALSEVPGMNETSHSNGIWVYPNPTTDILTVNNEFFKTGDMITLYDISGKLLRQRFITCSSTALNMASFGKGFYLLKYITEGTVKVIKLVKE
jgi:photosystem II stability/assembly factor-like uncharacterized protein